MKSNKKLIIWRIITLAVIMIIPVISYFQITIIWLPFNVERFIIDLLSLSLITFILSGILFQFIKISPKRLLIFSGVLNIPFCVNRILESTIYNIEFSPLFGFWDWIKVITVNVFLSILIIGFCLLLYKLFIEHKKGSEEK